MSRIGKQPITIPPKVKVSVSGQKISAEGPKGKLNMELHHRTSVKVEGDRITVVRNGEDSEARALHGLSRALVNNMVKGVSEGFAKQLGIQGVGFKAAVQGKNVNLSLGYSHPVLYPIPDQIKVTVLERFQWPVSKPLRLISKGRTRPWWAVSPLKSALSIRRNPIRARACGTWTKRSPARKARRFNNLTAAAKHAATRDEK